MIPIQGQPVLTAAEMRAAEAASGRSTDALMAEAGAGVAEQIRRLAADGEVLVACGPGNNGGDGYVAAAILQRAGARVRVAASTDPASEAARNARARWTGRVEPLGDAAPAPVLVDALFGTGLSRPLDAAVAGSLHRLHAAARLSIAVDLPSGVATDDGACLGDVPAFHVTLALGFAKPAHLLQPAAARCGAVRVLDLGLAARGDVAVLDRPELPPPATDAHKFTRGLVAVVAGAMPGAAALAASATARSGAGYVLLLGSATDRLPHAIVRRRYSAAALDDPRIGAILVGPGLGRDGAAQARLDDALATPHPIVLDGDALALVDPNRLARRGSSTILTPHAGEFAALFGDGRGSKIDRARDAARRSGAVVVFKGADTVVAHPDGRVRIGMAASPWLSTAGTGDVLAGIVAARLATGTDPFAAATHAVWLHGEAGRLAAPAFAADDLTAALPMAIAACL